jgi:hypothetical protein
MPVIVEHLQTRKKYIFLSASHSYFKDSRHSFLGTLFPCEESGEFKLAAICNEK